MPIIDSLQKISDTIWELPATYKQGMRVPARIIATEKLMREMDEAVYQQISNVATLPGIARYALCMPDGHSGYGFPIGGVAAMDVHSFGLVLRALAEVTEGDTKWLQDVAADCTRPDA